LLMSPIDRVIVTGSILVIIAGMILFGGGAMAVAQSSTDLQRQIDHLRAEVRDIRSEVRGVDREGSALARINTERLAALEREIEWTRWIVRGNFGFSGGVLGALLVILRRLNGQNLRREDER
jgi:uncharacterized protein YlxW (UPF0749 family)